MTVPHARPRLDDDELAAVAEVVQSGQLCHGAACERFEIEFSALMGSREAVAVSSGSAALLVAMQAMGIGRGDEVIVPDVTFVTTASAAVYLGATPVFCDISLDDYCVDVTKLSSLINRRTKLIVPVHLGGRVANVPGIKKLAVSRGIAVLEDAAGAHLSSRGGRLAGTLGDAAIFSFTPTKLITTGEGGMITTDDAALADRCRSIRNFGDRGKFAWDTLGFNFRMTAMAAALGCEQLKRLPEFLQQRRAIAEGYNQAFAASGGLTTPSWRQDEQPNHQLYPVLIDTQRAGLTRDSLIERLGRRGVASRLYYPALHRMRVFEQYGPYRDEQFPSSCHYERTSCCLPIFAGMTTEEGDMVVDAVLDSLSETQVSESA